MNRKELLELKEQIEESKQEKIKLEGRLEQVQSELKEKFDCGSLEEAQKKLTSMKKEGEKMNKKIEKATKALEEKYEFE